MPLTEIATRLGYTDLPNFIRAFKRWAGVGPNDSDYEPAVVSGISVHGVLAGWGHAREGGQGAMRELSFSASQRRVRRSCG
jgi:AraC-like DNA-binding protein